MPTWPTITDGVTRLSNALFGLIKTYIDDSLTGQGLPSGGATGDLLQKNSATNYDAGWTDAPTVDSVTLDTAAAEATGIAKIFWDATEGTVAFGMAGGVVTQQVGRNAFVRAKNVTASQINRGQVVYLTGAQGDRPTIELADATDESTSADTIGIAAEDIAVSAEGEICISGILANVNTYGLTAGVMTYLSETAGAWTQTRPTQPAHGVRLGIPLKISNSPSGNSGVFFVQVNNGYEFEELHDVLITAAAAGDILKRNAGNTLWVNTAPAALTKTDDTNVTLTLGGNASTALVNAASITAGWTGQLALARGGTGASTQQGALNAIAGAVTSGQYLRGDGANVTLAAIQAGDVPTLNQNTTGSAATLTTTRTLWGQNFNGSANVTGALTSVTDITMTGTLYLPATGVLNFGSGDVTVTASTNTLTFAGASSGYIFNDGNVGIGTASPNKAGFTRALTIESSSQTGLEIVGSQTTDAAIGNLLWINAAASNAYMGQVSARRDGANNSGALTFSTWNGGSGAERMRITATGNVGIGVTPTYRLDITGGAGSAVARFNQATAGKTGVFFAENGTQRAFLSQVGLYTGNSDGNFGIFVESGYNFQIATNGSAAAKLTVETSGVVTLASNLNLTAGQINFGAGPVGALYMSSSRLTVRSESTDGVAQFASYGMYLLRTGQTAGLYVESPIEARGGLRMGSGAANGTITYGATTGNTANRLVERDGSGHIYYQYGFGNYHNQSSANSENPTISQFWTQNTTDNYARKSSPQHVISQLGLLSNYGTSYYQANTWIQFNGNYGVYWPSSTGWSSVPHLWPSTSQTYGSLEVQGVKNSYAGFSILDNISRRHYLMGESGNFGLLVNNSSVWALYYYAAGNNIGYGGATTTSGYSHTFSGAAWFRNAVYVDSTITASGTKSFDITHPVVPTKRLRYAAIEGPRADVLHRGVATVSGHAALDLDAEAQLLPGTSAALMRDLQCQLTNLSETFCQLRGRLDGTTLHIYTDSPEPIRVGWLVLGERQDDEIKATTGTDADGRLISEYDADPTIGQRIDPPAAALQQE
jgi:hypothetical protein